VGKKSRRNTNEMNEEPKGKRKNKCIKKKYRFISGCKQKTKF
jgi:hypothetical protein